MEAWSANNWTTRKSPLWYFNVHSAVLTIGTVLHSRSLDHIHLAYEKLYTHWANIPHFSSHPPRSLVTTIPFSTLDIVYKRNQATFVLLWLASFICIMYSSFIHAVANGRISFFVKTEYIPWTEKLWRATAHGVTKSQAWLGDWACMHSIIHTCYLFFIIFINSEVVSISWLLWIVLQMT